MKSLVFALALSLGICSPLAAGAQPGPGDRPSPPPELRAKFDQIRGDAKTAADAALSAEHRTAVQGIVASVTSGALDPRAAGRRGPSAGRFLLSLSLTPEQMRAARPKPAT